MNDIMQSAEFKKIEREGQDLQAKADAFIIVDDKSRQEAGERLKTASLFVTQVEALTEAPWRSALNAYEEVQRWRKDLLARVLGPKKAYASKIGQWDLEIEQKRRREAAAAQAKADKLAKEKRDKEIAEAKERKDKEAVAALKAAPIPVAPITIKTQEPTKVEGISTRFKWVLDQIYNPDAVPRRFLKPDEKAINGQINSLGDKHGIPGVSVKQVPITTTRNY